MFKNSSVHTLFMVMKPTIRLTEDQKSTIRQRAKLLSKFDYTNVRKKFNQNNPTTAYPVEVVEEEYTKYLSMAGSLPSISPPYWIDMFWHEDILHTKDYTRKCNLVFGGYIHHNPSNGTMSDAKNNELANSNTIEAYRVTFGFKDNVLPFWELKKKNKRR